MLRRKKTNQTKPTTPPEILLPKGQEKHVVVCFHRKISLCSESESNMQGL